MKERRPAQRHAHGLGARPRIDDNDRQSPIRVDEGAALQVTPAASTDTLRTGTDDAKLCKGPKTLGHDVVLAIDKNELLVVVVIRSAVLDALPEQVRGEVGVHDAVEDRVCPGEAVASAAVGVPGRAPSPVEIAVLGLPSTARGAHRSADP